MKIPRGSGSLNARDLLAVLKSAFETKQAELDLSERHLLELPAEIGRLKNLESLRLANNQLSHLPESIGELTRLRTLHLASNGLLTLPDSIGQLTNLEQLDLRDNKLSALPDGICTLSKLRALQINVNRLRRLPSEFGQLSNLHELLLNTNAYLDIPKETWLLSGLRTLSIGSEMLTAIDPEIGNLVLLEHLYVVYSPLESIPEEITRLQKLSDLVLSGTRLRSLPIHICHLTSLTRLDVTGESSGNGLLASLPEEIGNLKQLTALDLSENQISVIPDSICNLENLRSFRLRKNQLTTLPACLAELKHLTHISLDDNPLNVALQSAYSAGPDELRAYLQSLQNAESLYEAKLVLVGEGGVGKTTLLKALTGRSPRRGEPTTHGIAIDVEALLLPHPVKPSTIIKFNAWDFGGQEVYRVTHQFFFSPRAIYLVVWEPRMGVQQGQVEDWLKLIRLRVGEGARVIVVSTHCRTGQRIARIDKAVFQRDYGSLIYAFHEVDSMLDDVATGDKVGIAELKDLIAEAAQGLDQMGMPFGSVWNSVREELIHLGQTEPHVTFGNYTSICAERGLTPIAARTLAILMNDLGYIVYYNDDDLLRDDVILQPEWLTKAIGFVLEDRITQEMEGILPDSRLRDIWWGHPFEHEPQYNSIYYPFFLRLMEKYDVSYRLEPGNASLVAQHVPQVRPELPWLPEHESRSGKRRICVVCVMDESPPGLVPWMIVRTHEYSCRDQRPDGREHRLHWQKGVFLRNNDHGEAMLELRGRNVYLYTEATWPEYFMNIIRQTLQKLISDNWPGLAGRYYFGVPCHGTLNGVSCEGIFDIEALSQFLNEGDTTYRCQSCRKRQDIKELLFGFEEEDSRMQLSRIESKLDLGFADVKQDISGLESRLANYVMVIMRAMANEAREGPRLFTIEPVSGWKLSLNQLFTTRYRVTLWCEADGCHHPLSGGEADVGVYYFDPPKGWLRTIAPYANFITSLLKTLLPVVAPAVNVFFGAKAMDESGWKDRLDLAKEGTDKLLKNFPAMEESAIRSNVLTEVERSGVLALHAFLRDRDPHHSHLGLRRYPTFTGDYLWLCPKHYESIQPRIPEKIE